MKVVMSDHQIEILYRYLRDVCRKLNSIIITELELRTNKLLKRKNWCHIGGGSEISFPKRTKLPLHTIIQKNRLIKKIHMLKSFGLKFDVTIDDAGCSLSVHRYM